MDIVLIASASLSLSFIDPDNDLIASIITLPESYPWTANSEGALPNLLLYAFIKFLFSSVFIEGT